MTDRAYIAGLFDGEGCVILYKRIRKPTNRVEFSLVVSIGNTHRPTLEWIKNQFGGSIAKRHNGTNLPVWEWKASNRSAYDFLWVLLPYCRIKKAQIELAIEAHETIISQGKNLEGKKDGQWPCRSAEQIEILDKYMEQLRELKRVGH